MEDGKERVAMERGKAGDWPGRKEGNIEKMDT